MHQTQYNSLTAINRNASSLAGGICKWWYTPINNISAFPAIDPLTQLLTGQPVLKNGTSWYGPIDIPRKKIGWKQQKDKTKAGSFYKHQVEAYISGIDSSTLINLENVGSYQICVVAKLRSGGLFIVLGNDATGCDVDDETTTGNTGVDTPGTKLVYTWESIDKALILTAFVP